MDRKSLFENLAAHGVRGLQPYVPGKPIDELEREYGISQSIKLASNENPLGPPASALRALNAAATQLALYPDGSGHALKQALADHFAIDPACLTLGNGSNDILVLLAESFLTPAVEAIFDQYSFVVYRLAAQAADAVIRIAPSNPAGHAQPYGHDLGAFTAMLSDRTRLIFIANPNNPTGTWISGEALYEFLKRVPAHTIVVVDEAYAEYVSCDGYPDTLGWLAQFPNLVVTRTFSKIYGLAGLRVGYAISHPDLAEILNRVRQPFNVNSLAQVAAIAALADQEFLQRARDLNRSGLAELTDAFTAMRLTVVPSIGNFVLVDLGRPAAPVYEALLRAGIIVRPVANYGFPNHLRITVGLPEQNRRLTATLRKIVEADS
ncbi:MAG: histidinol-phosphate transaminase [Gammaproteobacteria bacterium]|nr:histidinol-phosphate transaminase [Gammaproteobacteria bacterium]